MPFAISISILGLVQAALVALPGPLPQLPPPLRLRSQHPLATSGAGGAISTVIGLASFETAGSLQS